MSQIQSFTTSFRFQPGGTRSKNTYTDWAELMLAIAKTDGTKELLFDDSFGLISIPPGGYDMTDVRWQGPSDQTLRVLVTIPEGVSFTKFRYMEGFIEVDFTGLTPPVSDFSGIPDVVRLLPGATIKCSGTGPFFFIDAGEIGGIALLGGEIMNAGYEVFELGGVGATALGIVNFQSTIGANAIRGVVGSAFQYQPGDASARIDFTQTNFLGTALFRSSFEQFKARFVVPGDFGGGPPLIASVAFTVPFIDAEYVVTLTPETTAASGTAYSPAIENRTAAGFDINLKSAVTTDLIRIGWKAQKVTDLDVS